MAQALTNASTITCNHGATAVLTSTSKLKVNGSSVLLDGDTIAFAPGVCSQKGTGLTPCTSLTVSGGQASHFTVGGKKVLLSTLTGKTNGNPEFTFTVVAGQSKLRAS